MSALHLTEAEVVRDLAAVLEKVQQGVEVIVEKNNQPIAVISPPRPPQRTISDSIALARQRENERGYAVTLDPDFAADIEEVIRNRRSWRPRRASCLPSV
jgi:antitoxin (DNA-binding transcriptional repressor) of toxin-antitoxin stability system